MDKLKLLPLFLLAGIGIFLGSCSGQNANTKALTGDIAINELPDSVVMPVSLVNSAYQTNEIKADECYKNKRFNLYGNVDRIEKDGIGGAYIMLAGNVHCQLNDDQLNIASNLLRGEKIIIKGTCSGLVIGEVGMGDCIIVKYASRPYVNL